MTEKTEKSQTTEASEKKSPQKASKPLGTQKQQEAKSDTKAAAPKKSTFGIFFVFIVFLLALAALGFSAYIAQQGLLLRDDVSKLQTELSRLRLLDQQPIIQNLSKEIAAQNQAQQKLQEEINTRFKEWQNTLEEKQSLSERKKDDWILNEVTYLMRMASTRLYLASDINSAIAALTQADLRIAELENPRYLPIRKTIADEVSDLQALQAPDIDGTALKLEKLMNNLPTLPEAIVSQEQATPAENSNNAPTTFIAKLFAMVGIKSNAGKVPTKATHDNLLFLDQLIRLELESAKQALIRFKREEFALHLKQSKTLIQKHYKKNNETVIQVLDQLNVIIDSAVFPELPDITRSMNLLQSLLNRYKAPETESINEQTVTTEQAA